MARIWKEPHNGRVPSDYWVTLEPISERRRKAPTLLPQHDVMVQVASFKFRFACIEQLRDCLAYYDRKIHVSSRLPMPADANGWTHFLAQRWYERLPMFLLEKSRRKKVIKALQQALEKWEGGKL